MKPILIFCFVVSFGILTLLAEKITHLEQREGPASNADPSVIYHDALMKRGANRGTSGLCKFTYGASSLLFEPVKNGC